MMSTQLPFQVHVALNLYGATPEHLQQALKEACEQLVQGIPESHTVMQDQQAGFTFKVTAMNLDDNKPSPAIHPRFNGKLRWPRTLIPALTTMKPSRRHAAPG